MLAEDVMVTIPRGSKVWPGRFSRQLDSDPTSLALHPVPPSHQRTVTTTLYPMSATASNSSVNPPSGESAGSAATILANATGASAPAAGEHDLIDEDDVDIDAAEIAGMRARVLQMEDEAAKLRMMTAESERVAAAESAANAGGDSVMTDDEKEATDSRSVYVGNVRRPFFLSRQARRGARTVPGSGYLT